MSGGSLGGGPGGPGGPVVAVDLGDTSVAVSVDPGGRGPLDPVDVGCAEGLVDLAAVFAPPDGGPLVVGHEAQRRAAADPGRYEPTPRRRVDEGELLLGTRVVGVSEALGAVLVAALERVGPLLRGGRPALLVLTHPAGWGARRREVLRRAGSGLADVVRLLPEPAAVAAHAADLRPTGERAGGTLAVLDAGAAAVRAAVVDDGTVLAHREDHGPNAGAGDDADEALLAHVVAGLRADDAALVRVREVTTGPGLPERRHRQVLVEDVRAARERLSDAEQAPVPLPGRVTAAWCSREELAAVLRPAVDRAVALLRTCLDAAGVVPADLDAVWLVGGMARTPALAVAVHRALGAPPTVAAEPRLVVARGALAAVRAPARQEGAGPSAPRAPAARPGSTSPSAPPSAVPAAVPAVPGSSPSTLAVPPALAPAASARTAADRSRAVAALALPGWPTRAGPGADETPTEAFGVPMLSPPGRGRPAARGPHAPRWWAVAIAAAAAVVVAVVGIVATVRASSVGDVVTAFSATYPLPAGWVPDGEDAAARRSRLRPADAPSGPALIAVQEDPVSDDPTRARARIAERYAAARAGGQQVTGLDLAASAGGRPVVHYLQAPEPGTVVDWSVVFSGPLQLSVGCRYDATTRERVLAACARVVDGVAAR